MPSKDELSEEALTEILKKEAKESSIKYSALGLEAFLPKRSGSQMILRPVLTFGDFKAHYRSPEAQHKILEKHHPGDG